MSIIFFVSPFCPRRIAQTGTERINASCPSCSSWLLSINRTTKNTKTHEVAGWVERSVTRHCLNPDFQDEKMARIFARTHKPPSFLKGQGC